jgi:tetratricopeptide (TPR) repeat protein
MAAKRTSTKYKIRLETGRVLGPIDADRIAKLIRKGHVRGNEVARAHPEGVWKPLAHHPELADLMLAVASGTSTPEQTRGTGERIAEPVQTQILAATKILAPEVSSESPANSPQSPLPQPENSGIAISLEELSQATKAEEPSEPTRAVAGPVVVENHEPEDHTVVASPIDDEEGTKVGIALDGAELPEIKNIAQEKTVIFQRSSVSKALPGRANDAGRSKMRRVLILLALVFVALELFSDVTESPKKAIEVSAEIRPRLPSATDKKPDPVESQKAYMQGLGAYRQDALPEYRRAAEHFTRAVEADPQNVRAMAMLASSYLNLIDVSNKDETYFGVIQKLIELSRVKDLDLPETLIAEVEYLLFSQRQTAAQNRIIEYTKTHKNYDSIMFVYLAQVLLARGDYATAARYLSPLSDDKPYSVKVFHLRGQIAEGLGDPDAALAQYRKAVELNSRHGYSRYRILYLLEARAALKDGREHLVFLSKNADLLPARELAQVLSWRATVEEANGKVDVALGLVERALRLDSENPAYSLQHYLLRARAGDTVPSIRKEARLYYHIAEGERLARAGRVEDALVQYLEARRENPKSPLPFAKQGELFYQIKKDIVNARIAYQNAAELAPRDVRIWSKYIELLIQSYEWDEAAKAMARFRSLPVPQGIIDRVSADWHARQGRHNEAQMDYRKAMSRSYIDPTVYLAYGKSLIATKQYEQAPFIFSLAMRFDPESPDAILGTATALAGSEGIDRAVAYLQDELQKGRGTRVELLCGIASLLIQKGRLDQAEEFVEQAKTLRPEAAQPWKVAAELALARGTERKWKEKADEAYRAYLDRNPSDATVMYERYRVLVDLEKYEQADQELGRIYESYPKFPSLHFSKGLIYVRLANYKAALREFEQELKNGNTSTQNLIELGKAHLELKESDKALGYFIQAVKRSPSDSEPKIQAGRANFALSRYEAAVAMFQEAMKIDAGNPMVYRYLGYVYRAMGDAGNMRWAFNKYLEMEPDAADKGEIQQNL